MCRSPDRAAVVGTWYALHKSIPFQMVDEPGYIPRRGVEVLGELAQRGGSAVVKDFIITKYSSRLKVILFTAMLVAAGERAEAFCEAVRRLGERAEPLADGLPAGLQLLHIEAAALFGAGDGDGLSRFLDGARQQGALVSIDLGPPGAIRDRGGSRAAYQLARLQPDILFASQESAHELGAPLEGVGLVPVTMMGSEGCSVGGRRVVAPATGDLDPVAFMAAFCVAFVEGAAPLEAAGRAVLVGALSPR